MRDYHFHAGGAPGKIRRDGKQLLETSRDSRLWQSTGGAETVDGTHINDNGISQALPKLQAIYGPGLSLPPASGIGPNACSVSTVTVDEQGNPLPAQTLTFIMIAGPGTAGFAYSRTPLAATSNGSGLLVISLVQGATYNVRGSTLPGQLFKVPATPTAQLVELLNI